MLTYKETILKLTDVNYSVGGKQILRNINAEVKDVTGHGQVVAVIGPSGVGKSTLFNILSGRIKPDSGKIEIFMKEQEEYIEPREGVMGVVAQNYPLFEFLTVLDNLLIVNKKETVLSTVEQFGMSDHLSKYPEQLSGGQQQRIAIIQQILCSERYILMDEPFSGLDCIAKCEVCKLIKTTADHNEYNTVIVVTHGIDDAIRVADTLWLLGRDKGVPGAYIKEVISLGEKGMAWKCCSTPELGEMSKYITNKFKEL
jgi:ABC-type nitrate/sulfonate/bicarbonate transport system ATPase subunit